MAHCVSLLKDRMINEVILYREIDYLAEALTC